MSQSKKEFCQHEIDRLIGAVIERESIPEQSQSYDDFKWVKFYVRDLTTQCKECSESQNDTSGVVSKKD